MGVWIEMSFRYAMLKTAVSLPTWECGLKYPFICYISQSHIVTPYVGVWIEIIVPYNAADQK